MRILLLGAGGQLGTELRERLRSLGPLIATARRPLPPDGDLTQLLDVADLDALRAAIRKRHPQVIVNATAYTAVDAAEQNREQAFAVNAETPRVLAEAASEMRALLVHYSTDYVFGQPGDRPWREEDRLNPINVYGESKAAGETAIRQSGAAHLILRTSWLYGPAGPNFVKTMLRLAQRSTDLRVVSDQIGTPTSAPFVAQATAQILASLAGNPSGESIAETVHVACAGQTTWHDFAAAIFELAQQAGMLSRTPKLQAISSSEYPTAARRPCYSPLDTGKLRQRFAIEPLSWREELRKVLPAVYASLMRELTEPPR